MPKILRFFILFLVLMLPIKALSDGSGNAVHAQAADTQTPPTAALSAADVINAVNNLRLSQGLTALTIHPVLMNVAAQQASALAASNGSIGHQRPCGMTLGQQLLIMGFPLWGDLSLDGFRAENWTTANTVEDVISSWLSDAEHTNTMLSLNVSDIGAAVVTSDQTYVVLETALKTSSGQHQSTAYDILTSVPMTQSACLGLSANGGDGSVSQYSVPVIVSTARPDGDVIHEVQYGQTLWSIAIQYNTTIDELKRLNNLPDNTIAPGWKLLIQKGATPPAPTNETQPSPNDLAGTPTETKYPTAVPYYTGTPTITSTVQTVPLGQQIKQNSTVVVALMIAFSVLLAGIIGFGKKKEE